MKRGNAKKSSFRFLSFGLGFFAALIASLFAQSGSAYATIPSSLITQYAENNILYYDPCDGNNGDGGGGGGGAKCAKLSELRTKMWDDASDEYKAYFMGVVSQENYSIAGVEGYMNQIISKHGTTGELKDWIDNQCSAFRGGSRGSGKCHVSHTINSEEQSWIDDALAGSNNLKFAIGNATGGSSVGMGKIICVWDGEKCREDVDYTKNNGKGKCVDYAPTASFGECWGDEGESSWVESMASQCAGDSSVGVTTSNNSSGITWDSDGWITGGMSGFTKEPSKSLVDASTKYTGGKPNKIVLHYTQGTTDGLAAYGADRAGVAAHFTIDLKNKVVSQHVPISKPSGAMKDKADVLDAIQIEIVGYGFQKNNPKNPTADSKCIIDGVDYTDSGYCFAKFGDEEWDYLATLLSGISKWGSDNNTEIPLTSSVTWTGNVNKVRLSKKEWNKTSGIVAHMHAPYNDHNDTGNIWPFVSAAISRTDCVLTGDEDSISGAKNAEKKANEVGAMTWHDGNKSEMKALLENYGDLAYRTGKAYDIPWVAILVQGRYEDPKAVCGSNNFWGIKCYDGSKAGQGSNVKNLGEGFTLYGKTVHNGYHDKALGISDPKKYLDKLRLTWASSQYKDTIDSIKKTIDDLNEYIESDEGQKVVAAFGAAGCSSGGSGFCGGGDGDGGDNASNDIVKNVEYLIDLANKQGATYKLGGSGRSISSFKKFVKEGKPLTDIDCTGFASLVYWYTYGNKFKSSDIFDSNGIIDGGFSSYKEVNKSDVRPGDIFAYRGHGGIVIEVQNGKVTKIAETGGSEGRSGKNKTLGYSGSNDYSVRHMNTSAGHFFRWKGAK